MIGVKISSKLDDLLRLRFRVSLVQVDEFAFSAFLTASFSTLDRPASPSLLCLREPMEEMEELGAIVSAIVTSLQSIISRF
jgi:hypothetical protein